MRLSEEQKKISKFVAGAVSALSGLVTLIEVGVRLVTKLAVLPKMPVVISENLWCLLTIFLIASVVFFLLDRKNVRFFGDRKVAPKKFFDINARIKDATKRKMNLTVVGRTNRSWFEEIETKRELYKKALLKECEIRFVIQHEITESISIKDKTKIENIKKERENTIKSFKEIYEFLKKDKDVGERVENFRLWFTFNSVDNSMTAQYKDGKYNFFSYDVGLNIDANPYLVFRNDSVTKEIKDKFTYYQKEGQFMTLKDYTKQEEEGAKELAELLDRYSEFSEQRQNNNKKLMYHYFKREEKLRQSNGQELYPPVSIQLLLTNGCTTACSMCGHHGISSQGELQQKELKDIIDWIVDIGTKNIIVSGGEPLSRIDCIDILEYAKEKGLNVGLFTNGVKHGNVSINNDDAARIGKSCDWVQLSVDSFDRETYEKIRKANIDIVLQSEKNLKAVGVNLEVAFTIQKLNFDEAVAMVESNTSPLEDGTKIRFKFAHSQDESGIAEFLLSGTDKDKLIRFIGTCNNRGDSKKFNTKYLSQMFGNGYFSVEDVIAGSPLLNCNKNFERMEYVCHIMNYSCKIDAFGNLYPCCYLYDPNSREGSEIRKRYVVDSLRSTGGFVNPDEFKLKKLLSTKKFEQHRTTVLPIRRTSCNCCTRHCRQNAFLNELDNIVKKYEKIILLKESYFCAEDKEKIWV